MSIESIYNKINNITDGGRNTAAEMRAVLSDITEQFSATTAFSGTTDNVPEGSGNLYYTDTRVDAKLLDYSLTGHTHNLSELNNDVGYLTGATSTADDYVTGSTFNTTTGLLEFTRLSGDTFNVNLDGRYLTGYTPTVNTDDYITSATFNSSTGEVTLTRVSGGTVVTNLDNRYSLTGHTHTDYVLNSDFNTHTGDTSVHYTKSSINLSDLGATGHTHTVSNITDFPTNLSYFTNDSGYLTGATNTTDFISHTGDTTIHYAMSGISINESQISDLGSYTDDTNLNAHTGDTSIHFTKSSINLSDLGSSAHTHTEYSLIGHNHDISEITGFTDNSTNWNTAYSDSITGVTVTGSGTKTLTLTQRDGSTIVTNFTDLQGSGGGTGEEITGATFNLSTGDLTLITNSGSTIIASLDGRYAFDSQFITHTGDTTIHFTKGSINLSDLASTGHTHNLSLLNNDIGFITGYTDTNDNIYVTGSTFNTGNGVLTFSNISGGTFTVDLDGRYLTGYTETSNTDDYVSSAAFNTTNGILTLTRISGGTVTVDLDDRYSLTGHTHTASQITDFSDAVTGNTAVLANTDKISYTDATLVANTASGLVSHTGDTSIHFTKGSINLSDLGATGHTHSEYTLNAVLNSHTGDTSIHYTKGSINLSDLGSSAHTHTVSNISDFPTNVSSFTNDSGYITGFTDTNNNDYVTSGAFDTGNGNLTLTRVSGGTVVTNLDNRYSLTGHTHSIYALDSEFTSHTGDTSIHYAKNTINLSELGSSAHTHAISELSDFPTNVSSFTNDAGYLTGYTDTNVYLTGATVTGTTTKSINLFQSDGSLVQASFTDLQGSGGGGDTITGVTFNTSTGDLDLVSTGSTITANLDGRYSLTGHTHSEYTLDSIFNSHTGDTSIHFTKGSINLSDLGSSAHTHTISNITDFPTNVSYFTNDSGYLTGYTDTNEYITDGTFNTSTGNLDLITNSGTTITANLDGRYLDLSAATTIVETLVATGGETQWVLSSTPSSGYSRTLFNENIYLVENVDWSLSGNTIIFSGSSSPLISGDVITFYYHDVSAPLAQLNTYGRVFEDSALSGTTDIDWGSYETFVYTLSGATVFSDINLPSNGKSKTITVYMTGNFAPTYPSGWSTYINGTYNGLVLNTIVVEYVASSTPFYKVMITQPD